MKKKKTSPLWRTLETIGGVSLGLIMFYTVTNIVVRSTVGVPLPAVVELVTRWWMVPFVLAGLIFAQSVGEHVRVDFVGDNLGRRAAQTYWIVSRLFLIVFMIFVVIGGWQEAVLNMQRGEFGIDTGWPVWVTRFVIPLLGTAFLVFLCSECWTAVRSRGKQRLGEDIPLKEGLV